MKLTFTIAMMLIVNVLGVVSAPRNRNSLDEDTALVAGLKAGTSKYSKWMELSEKEDIAVVVKIDDTTSDGFSGDSIAVMVGYQVADPSFDSSNEARNECKARGELIVLDTFLTDSLGKAPGYGYEDTAGVIHQIHGRLDTTNIPGWAYWRRCFYPEWGVFIRFFFVPLTGHCNTATPVEVSVSRRHYMFVRNR